ncbi:hypothetical protein D9M72_647740 [compost metagenome]
MMGKLWAGFGDHRPYPYIALHLSDVDIRQALHLHFDCTMTVEVPYLAVHAAAVPQRFAQQVGNIRWNHLQYFLTVF